MADAPMADPKLQEKARKKCLFVQDFIRSLERAWASDTPEDRQWLRKVIDPSDTVFKTLVFLVIEPKYKAFAELRCVALRALQILLRFTSQYIDGSMPRQNIGIAVLVSVAGEEMASQVYEEVKNMTLGSEPDVACNAMLLLGEFGPQAFPSALLRSLLTQLLDLFVALPERADDLVEVALRAHSWGFGHRAALLDAIVSHQGGQLLCEVLLQVINRAEKLRCLRAVKVLTGCMGMPNSERLLYTNDIRVLVEILERELPKSADDIAEFGCHADCLKALAMRCEAARVHRRGQVLQVLEDLRDDERCPRTVREKSAEVHRALAHLIA